MAPSFKGIRNIAVALFVAVFLITSFRCYLKRRRNRLWHDDWVALLSSLSFIFHVIGFVLIATEPLSQYTIVSGCYFTIIGYHMPIWSARISIVLTVLRVTPPHFQKDTLLLSIIASFVLMFAMLTAQVFWICELTDPTWKDVPGAFCRFPIVVPVLQIIAAVVSDAILVAMPLVILGSAYIPALRIRLFFIFSASVATTTTSLAHAVLLLVEPGPWQVIAGLVETAVSITVCNMSVIFPAALRYFGASDPFIRDGTLDLNLSTIEVPHATSPEIEPGISNTRDTAIGGSEDSGPEWNFNNVTKSFSVGVSDNRGRQFAM